MKALFSLAGPEHSVVEDAISWVTGCVFVSLGMVMFKSGHISTGGTAGLSILGSYLSGLSVGTLFFLVNVPFFVWSIIDLGWSLSVKSLMSVALISSLVGVQGSFVTFHFADAIYPAIAGGLITGVGFLILFRHGFSVGGLSLVAFSLSRRLGFGVGKSMLVMDAIVVTACALTIGVEKAAASAISIVAINFVVHMNHTRNRYIGTST